MTTDLNHPALGPAATDLRWLLSRGYPRETSLTLVGNRHDLDRTGREILRRGVMSSLTAARRRGKLRPPEAVARRPLALDGHNVILTLESALTGRLLVRGDDGVIRDIARAARGYRLTEASRRTVDLLLGYLARLKPASVNVWLDRPVSHSGRLAELIRAGLAHRGLDGDCRTAPVPERELIPFAGLVASADGELIEACPEPIDLVGAMLAAGLIDDWNEVNLVDSQT